MKNKNAEKITSRLLDEFARIRKEKGLSHEKLGALTGLSRSTFGLLENKKRTPTITNCLKICDALEVSLSDLLKSINKS